ncbi:MAG: helix-turn-helix transcriptional regulator [Clostridia bacterium]|nr:helix-turn-helix transcriptional regulator [Clostridia bacterium]
MIEPVSLLDMDFSVSGIYVKHETWNAGSVYDYTEQGRVGNLLHYIMEGSRTYDINGRKQILRAGSVILIPDGTLYRTETRQNNSGIGVCFDLFRTDGTPISLLHELYTVEDDGEVQSRLFYDMLRTQNGRGAVLHRKSVLWQILDRMLSSLDAHSADSVQLAPAIQFLQKHYRENHPVSVYASVCHMSESYFRRRFSEYTGMSPLEYRDQLRFTEAEFLLSCGMTVTKTAEQVGYCDASYLRRLYKKRTGHPLRGTGIPEII